MKTSLFFALLILCGGCKFGNVERGDLPLVPVWHQEQTRYPNYERANQYEREMGYFTVDETCPVSWFVDGK